MKLSLKNCTSLRRQLLSMLFVSVLAVTVSSFSNGEQASEEEEKEITWYAFDWLPSASHSNLVNTQAIMRIHPAIENVPGFKGFQLCIDVADSYLYESAFNSLLWRKPGVEDKIIRLQAAGRTQTSVIEQAEVTLDGDLIGYDDFRVIDSRSEPEDAEISGFLGYNFLRAIKKILVIDHQNNRFALLDELPEKWEKEAHLVVMQASPSFLGLRIRANGKRIRLSFDGESTPALVLYRNRDFRNIASERSVPDSLRYFYPQSNRHIMLEGRAPKTDLYFGPYKLKSHNVYLMPERDRRLGSDRGLITQPFFQDYILIIDFKNDRFGIVTPSVLD